MAKLRFLNLSGNSFRVLENLEGLTNLEYLNVSKNKLCSLGCLEKNILPNLKHLICSQNVFPITYLETLEKVLIKFGSLEELDFVGNEIILNKAFVPKMSHLISLKILNGVPVFRAEGVPHYQRKVNVKQKSDVKVGSTGKMDYIIDYDALKGLSLQEISKNREEYPTK